MTDRHPATTVRFPAARLAAAMAIIGTIGAFVVEAGLDPVTTVFWRCVFATAFLAAWCLARGYLPDQTLNARRLALAAAGGACMVLSWTAFFAGFRLTSIATTTIVYHVQPFFVMLLGAVVYRERMNADQLGFAALAFAGVVLASGLVGTTVAVTPQWFAGIALVLGAAALYAVATLLAKGLAGQRPEVTALTQTVTGVVMLAPFAHLARHVSASSWGWLAGIGLLHTGVAYVLMYSAYPALRTPLIGVLTFIYPLVAILVDWTIYGHQPSFAQLLGMGLIAAGTLAVRLELRPLRSARRLIGQSPRPRGGRPCAPRQ